MSRKQIFLCMVILISHQEITAANDNYPFGARQAGMANASVALHDFWAISHNQAGLSALERPTAGVYFENRYLVKEMGLGALGFAMPVNEGVLGISLSYFGYSQYNESKIGLAYARSFGERLSVGLQINYMHSYVGGNHSNSAGSVTFETGIIYELFDGLFIGAHIFNPTRSKLVSANDLFDEYIPSIIRFGMAYSFSEKLLVSVEAEKDILHKPVLKAGAEYRIADRFYARGGIGSNPTQNAFGVGMYTGMFTIDLSASFHHVLGYSPQVSIMVAF